jgi:hypothetical protein
MKTLVNRHVKWLVFPMMLLLLGSCNKEERKEDMNGFVEMRMTDRAGIYEEINIDLQKISVLIEPLNGPEIWRDLPTNAGLYNLMDLTLGREAMIVDQVMIPAGKIQGMKFHLGKENWIKVDGVVHELRAPRSFFSDVRMSHPILVKPAAHKSILLDFDAEQSILHRDRMFFLRPVIFVQPFITEAPQEEIPVEGKGFSTGF